MDPGVRLCVALAPACAVCERLLAGLSEPAPQGERAPGSVDPGTVRALQGLG